MEKLHKRTSWMIFIIGMVIFTFALPNREFIGFESRFALFVQTMLAEGFSWFPHTYQGPYPDYPGTSTWVLYALAKLTHSWSFPLAVLPSAVCSALTMVLVYRIGAHYDAHWGISAVAWLCCTQAFLEAGRSLTLDPYLMLTVTAAFYYLNKEVSQKILNQKTPSIKLFFLFFLGFILRGPIGWIMPVGVSLAIYFHCRRWRAFGLSLASAALAFAAGASLLASLAYLEGGKPFLETTWHYQVASRVGQEAHEPFYFYIFNGLGIYSLPYALSLILAIIAGKRLLSPPTRVWQFMQTLFIWGMVILLGMSIPSTKKLRYVLPMAPAWSLFISGLFIINDKRKVWLRYQKSVLGLLYLLPWGLLCGLIYILFSGLAEHYAIFWRVLGLSLGIIPLLVILIRFWHVHDNWQRSTTYLIVTAVCLVLTNIMIIEPVRWELSQTKSFTSQVEPLRKSKQAELYFYQVGPDGDDVKYMINTDLSFKPKFIHQEAELSQLAHSILILRNEHYLSLKDKLSRRCILSAYGKIGHHKYVALYCKA